MAAAQPPSARKPGAAGSQLIVDRQASGSADTAPNLQAPPRSAISAQETMTARYGGPGHDAIPSQGPLPSTDPHAPGAPAGSPRASAPSGVTVTPDRGSRSSLHATEPARLAARLTGLAWIGLGAITAIVLIAVVVRSPSAIHALEETEADLPPPRSSARVDPPSAPKPPPPATASTAPTADLDAARLLGLSALGPLGVKYPNDPAVLKALMLAHATEKSGFASAVGVAKRLFEIAPKTAGDDDMRRMLLRIANGPIDVATLALDAMGSKMGSFGPDMLYEISNDLSMGKFPRERAGKLIDNVEVRKLATPALLIAMELRPLQPCARKPLFARARDEGDARSLPFLKPLLITDGCSKLLLVKIDCHTCLGDRADLLEAVKAIEARSAKH